jgi:hypothetical protein
MPVTRRNPQIPDYSSQAATQASNMAVPRPDYNGGPLEPWMANEVKTNPQYSLPRGYKVDDNGNVTRDTHSALDDIIMKYLPAAGFGIAGGAALGGGGGATGSGEVAAEGSGLPTAGAVGGDFGGETARSAVVGLLGGLGKIGSSLFGGRKLDPTSLLLGGLSLFGGKDPNQRESFAGTGADPVNTLSEGLASLKRLAASIGNYQPTQSNLGPGTPAYVPSSGLQVGGGLATSPEMKAMLAGPPAPVGDPFSLGQAQTPSTGRRRPV